MAAETAEVWVLQEIEPPIEFADLSTPEHQNHQPLDCGSTTTQNQPLIVNSPLKTASSNKPIRMRLLAAPFVAILRWGGLYFELDNSSRRTTENRYGSATNHRKRRVAMHRLFSFGGRQFSESLSFCLCSLSLIVAAVDDARLMYTFFSLWSAGQLATMAMVVDNLVTIVWAIQCLAIHVILMSMCFQRRFTILFDAWEETRNRYPDTVSHEKSFDFNRRFRSKQRLLITLGVAALVLNCYSLLGPLLIPIRVYEDFKIYVMAPFHPENMVIKALIVAAFTFRSFDYVFSATLFLLLSDAIVLQFTQFYEELSAKICDDGSLKEETNLEWYRLKHAKLCILVERVDAIFSPYVLIGLGSGMFGLLAQVFVIYDFLKRGEMGVIVVLSYVYFSLLNLAQVLVILWSGSKVNVAALLPLSRLYEIDQRTLSVQEIQHLTVFLQKLSGCQTGYTALGIFTIDMTTILSLAGFYFTYQILLFQMRNDSSLDAHLKKIHLPDEVISGLREFLNSTFAKSGYISGPS